MVLQVPDPAASQYRFGKIASPLWLQMPNVFAAGTCHHSGEYFSGINLTIIYEIIKEIILFGI